MTIKYITSQLENFINEKIKETDDQKEFLLKLNEFIESFKNEKDEKDIDISSILPKNSIKVREFVDLREDIEIDEDSIHNSKEMAKYDLKVDDVKVNSPITKEEFIKKLNEPYLHIRKVILSILEKSPSKLDKIREGLKEYSLTHSAYMPTDIEIRGFLDELCNAKRIIFCPQFKTEPTQWKLNPDFKEEFGWGHKAVANSTMKMNQGFECSSITETPKYPPNWISTPKKEGDSTIESSEKLDFSEIKISEAIPLCLKQHKVLSNEKILSLLRKGNLKTHSIDFPQSISVALNKLKSKEVVQNIGRGVWRLTSTYLNSLPKKTSSWEEFPTKTYTELPKNLKIFSMTQLVSYVLYIKDSITITDIVAELKSINKEIDLGDSNTKLWTSLTYLQKMDRVIKSDNHPGKSLWSLNPSYKEELNKKYSY